MLIAAIAGRVAFGKLADLIGPMPAWMVASLWQTAWACWPSPASTSCTLLRLAPVYGFGYAGVMTGVLVTARALTPASAGRR